MFIDIEENVDDSRIKRWRIVETPFSKLVPFNDDDLPILPLLQNHLKKITLKNNQNHL